MELISPHPFENWTLDGPASPSKEGLDLKARVKKRGFSARYLSDAQQSAPSRHRDSLCPAQDVELAKERLDVALDRHLSYG